MVFLILHTEQTYTGPSSAHINEYSNNAATTDAVKKYGDYGFSFVVYGDYLAISAPSFQSHTENEMNGKIFIHKYDVTQQESNAWKANPIQVIDPPHRI